MADGAPERNRFTTGLALATFTPLALAPLLSSGSGTTETLGILVIVGYAGHLAVTGCLWAVPDVRETVRARPVRLVAVPATLVLAASAIALGLPDRNLERLLLGFFAWQFFHFARQNLGLVAMVAARWGARRVTKVEQRLVMAASWCGIAVLMARPTLLGLPRVFTPWVFTGVVTHMAEAGFAGCALAGVVAAFRARRPTPVAVAQLTAVLFMTPVFVFHGAGASVTGLVVAHGLQYQWVVGWRARAAGRPGRRAMWRTVAVMTAIAVLGGAVLEAISELHASHVAGLRLLYGVYLGLVMAHFVVDAQLWRRPAPTVRPTGPGPLLPSLAHGRL